MTTPAEDVTRLRRAIVDLLHTAPFDDMLWPEMLVALQLVARDVKVVFASEYAGFDKAPPPFPLDPDYGVIPDP